MSNTVPPPALPAGAAADPYLPGLTGLRAIACLMVFAVHFGQTTRLDGQWWVFDLGQWMANGNAGVALFFSLSGFVLSLPHWRAVQAGEAPPALGPYLLRRAARVLPAYYVCLTALLVIHQAWTKDDKAMEVLLHYLLLFNFDARTIFAINPPFWTLAVEAQFYLLLPLLMWAVRSPRLDQSMLRLAGLSLLAYGVHVAVMWSSAGAAGAQGAAPDPSPVLTYSLLAHLPHFLFGCITAAFFTANRFQGRGPVSLDVVLLLAVLGVVLTLATPLDALLQLPFGRYNLPFVPALLCLIILLAPVTWIGRHVLEWAPLRGIGVISYGVYIYHLPVQNATARAMGRAGLDVQAHWAIFGAASLAVTLAVATLSYWLVERWVLRAIRQRRQTLVALSHRT